MKPRKKHHNKQHTENKKEFVKFEHQSPCKNWTNIVIHCENAYFTGKGNNITRVNLKDITDYDECWATADKGLNKPKGMAVYEGNLYVCNFGNNTISRINLKNRCNFEAEWFNEQDT